MVTSRVAGCHKPKKNPKKCPVGCGQRGRGNSSCSSNEKIGGNGGSRTTRTVNGDMGLLMPICKILQARHTSLGCHVSMHSITLNPKPQTVDHRLESPGTIRGTIDLTILGGLFSGSWDGSLMLAEAGLAECEDVEDHTKGGCGIFFRMISRQRHEPTSPPHDILPNDSPAMLLHTCFSRPNTPSKQMLMIDHIC